MNKEQLGAKIWAAANKMRTKMESNEYKNFVIGLIYYEFLSEREETFLKNEYGLEGEDLEIISIKNDNGSDESEFAEFKKGIQQALGYFISRENLFSSWMEKGKGLTSGNAVTALNAFNEDISPEYRPVFENVFTTFQEALGKAGGTDPERGKMLQDLCGIIKDIPCDGKDGYDVLGYIYEYLIQRFAAGAGSKSGEFYTPNMPALLISSILAHHLAGRKEVQIYDPTSGSGSLLLDIAKELKDLGSTETAVSYYAQEIIPSTYNLTRMNLMMHGVTPANVNVRCGDSLSDDWPFFDETTPYKTVFVDGVVSNPPYSASFEGRNKRKNDPRFKEYGLAPATKADYAFLLHGLYHLKDDGMMGIVLPHGVLFRGGDEETIRRKLIDKDQIETIIGLAPNQFYGTSIPVIIMILRKKRDESDVLFVDASQLFHKVKAKNEMSLSDIRRVYDAVIGRKDIENFCRLVSKKEIEGNKFNLNIPRYVSASQEEKTKDLKALVCGGIPQREIEALHEYWNVFPGLREEIFESSDDPYTSIKMVDIRKSVMTASCVTELQSSGNQTVEAVVETLKGQLFPTPENTNSTKTKEKVAGILMTRMESLPLFDPYKAYQIFMDHWAVIEGDLERIQREGFGVVNMTHDEYVTKKKKDGTIVEEFDKRVGDILPYELIQRRLLSDLLAKRNEFQDIVSAEKEAVADLINNMDEDQKNIAGEALKEDGEELAAEKNVNAQIRKLKEIKDDPDAKAVLLILEEIKGHTNAIKKANKDLKTLNKQLDDNTRTTIETMDRKMTLKMLDAKWIDALKEDLDRYLEHPLEDLYAEIVKIQKRYAKNLNETQKRLDEAEGLLKDAIPNLTGVSEDMQALNVLLSLLGGD